MNKNGQKQYATDEKIDKFFADHPEFEADGHDRFLTDDYIDAYYCADKNGYYFGCEECPFCTTCELYDNAMREYLAK